MELISISQKGMADDRYAHRSFYRNYRIFNRISQHPPRFSRITSVQRAKVSRTINESTFILHTDVTQKYHEPWRMLRHTIKNCDDTISWHDTRILNVSINNALRVAVLIVCLHVSKYQDTLSCSSAMILMKSVNSDFPSEPTCSTLRGLVVK